MQPNCAFVSTTFWGKPTSAETAVPSPSRGSGRWAVHEGATGGEKEASHASAESPTKHQKATDGHETNAKTLTHKQSRINHKSARGGDEGETAHAPCVRRGVVMPPGLHAPASYADTVARQAPTQQLCEQPGQTTVVTPSSAPPPANQNAFQFGLTGILQPSAAAVPTPPPPASSPRTFGNVPLSVQQATSPGLLGTIGSSPDAPTLGTSLPPPTHPAPSTAYPTCIPVDLTSPPPPVFVDLTSPPSAALPSQTLPAPPSIPASTSQHAALPLRLCLHLCTSLPREGRGPMCSHTVREGWCEHWRALWGSFGAVREWDTLRRHFTAIPGNWEAKAQGGWG